MLSLGVGQPQNAYVTLDMPPNPHESGAGEAAHLELTPPGPGEPAPLATLTPGSSNPDERGMFTLLDASPVGSGELYATILSMLPRGLNQVSFLYAVPPPPGRSLHAPPHIHERLAAWTQLRDANRAVTALAPRIGELSDAQERSVGRLVSAGMIALCPTLAAIGGCVTAASVSATTGGWHADGAAELVCEAGSAFLIPAAGAVAAAAWMAGSAARATQSAREELAAQESLVVHARATLRKREPA